MQPEYIFAIVGGGIALILVIILLWYITTLNNFRKMRIKIDESISSIDVALTKRYDLLTKMLTICKNHAKHEQNALLKIIELRQPLAMSSIHEKSAFAAQMVEAMKNLNLIVEKDSDLKANKTFIKLQNAAVEVEENLQAARRFYNGNVRMYNRKVIVFPSNLVARHRGFGSEEFFEAEDTSRGDVDENF